MEKGRIIKSSGGFYYVDNGSEIIECRARGKFRKDKISPCVGDFVDVELTADSKGYVVAINERKNVLSRPSVSNIDRLLLIAAAADPAPNRFVIDKILTIAEYQDIDTVLIVTKTDVADANSLIEDYRRAGYTVIGVNSLEDDVSEIRELIKDGKLDEATEMLGLPYFVEGVVEKGLGLGKAYGFPTVNTPIRENSPLSPGVYRTAVETGGKIYTGVTNVGSCPTVKEREIHTETLIADFDGNLYGEKIRIYFLGYLRQEKQFNSIDKLREQIYTDKQRSIEENGDLTWLATGQN
jgi:hypothetical protein